ncbi:MAG: condensation domain-containing protein, partial [Gammaproteobacteria bacterium]
VLELATDRYSADGVARAVSQTYVLDESTGEQLGMLSREEGCTLFITLLAAFNTLLCRLSGQTDVIVGAVVADRSRTELEEMIGAFSNTLMLRTDL